MVEPLRHRQTKGAATDMFYLTPPRHISTLHISEVEPRIFDVRFRLQSRPAKRRQQKSILKRKPAFMFEGESPLRILSGYPRTILCPRGIRFAMPSGIKKASRLRLLGRLSPTCPRASFIFPCQAVTERRRQKGFATGRACTAIAFVFRKACSRACRSSFALACRPLSRYFCK
jgi:hypothetical protein